MDLQFFGANCIVLTNKGTRIVIDDNLESLGAKSVTRPDDVAVFTSRQAKHPKAKLVFDGPGEYEVADISITGIPSRGHMEEAKNGVGNTMFKLVVGDTSIVVVGHAHPDVSASQLEAIGTIDILFVPIGGSGFTLDPIGALRLVKEIEPKIVIPTHYADTAINYEVPQSDLESALKDMAMIPKERTSKLKIKANSTIEFAEGTSLVVLEKS
jgi:L-ascorbate metabolism protein UlaG (beta-lactamase superfamily)